MNFFKALFSINSLRKEVEHLRQSNIDSAMHQLQLVSQLEQQRREIQSLHDKMNGGPVATMKPARKYYKRKPKTTQQ
jgi:TolA-binding protein